MSKPENSDSTPLPRLRLPSLPWIGVDDPGVLPSAELVRVSGNEAAGARRLRFRRGLDVGYVMWCAFIAMDWMVVQALGAPRFGFFLACRLAVMLAILPVVVRLHRGPQPSPRLLTGLELVAFVWPALGIGVMCAEFRGLASPYAPGLCLVLLARAVTAQEPWRRGLVLSAAPVAAFYLVLLGSAFFLPRVAAQLRDPAALTTLALSSGYIFGTYLFQVVGAHVVWSLRRQVFQARKLGRYRLKRRLDAGGMGDVWIAHHPGLKRDVAIKILWPGGGDERSAIRRFEREARATSELSHPNTVRVFDYGATEDGLLYYVMELLEGETMAARVARLGPVAPARALKLAGQAARALGEAHHRGIVHRDVTPRNLFLATLGGEIDFVKVLDFGIAKVASTGEEDVTRAGVLLGTPEYISPEVAHGQTADARADVYGLGAVVYFLLTGTSPFTATTAMGIVRAHAEATPASPSKRTGRAVPSDLEAVVMRCLAKDPAARFRDGAELALALAGCTEAATWSLPVLSRSEMARMARVAEAVTVDGGMRTGEVQPSPVAESVPGIESSR